MTAQPTMHATSRGNEGRLASAADGLKRELGFQVKSNGQQIAHLTMRPETEERALVLISPGLGRTIRHSTPLALAFAHEGYATVRYDCTNHAGLSDGDMLDATLSSAADDMTTMAEAARSGGWAGPIYGVAASISARAVVRAAASGAPLDGLVLVLPVVDFASSLREVTGEDLVGAYAEGLITDTDTINVLTHELSGRFLADAIAGDYCSLASTRRDLEQIGIPLAAIAAERDDWVRPNDVAAALGEGSDDRRLFLLETAGHESYSFGFMRTLSHVAVRALAAMDGGSPRSSPYQLEIPELTAAIKLEKPLLRQGHRGGSRG